MTLKIAVLVSVGRNPVSGAARACPNDVAALELARHVPDSAVTLFHAGPAGQPGLADYLAYGAAAIEHLVMSGDILPALAGALADFDLILCGSRAEQGEQSGMLPYLLAENLRRPIVAAAAQILPAGRHVDSVQYLPKGARREIRVTLPAIIAIHPLAPVAPRYAHARKVAGTIRARPVADGAPCDAVWQLEPAMRRPIRLKAVKKEAGHRRMQSAIASESKGGVVISEGTVAEKAQTILTYLRTHGLTDR